MFQPKKILVPTDFSEYSDSAFQMALDIAKQSGAAIMLLHVIGQDLKECMADYCFTPEEFERFRKGIYESSEEYLKRQLEKFPGAKDVKVDPVVCQGVPYEEILNYQTENNVDLIVIATHGRSGITRYLMGSVASKVINGATCEVLVLK